MDQALGLVAGLDQLAALLVLAGVLLGVLDHFLDVGVGESARGLDADLLLLAGRLVLGRDVDDAVGVDVERDLDLRHAARRRRNPDEVELAQELVVGRHLALALEDADGHRGLVVLGGREHLALARRDRRVALDEAGEHAAQRLDAERERGHVEEQHVLDVAGEHGALDRGADGDDLVGVDALVRLAPEEVLHRLDHLRHAGHAADEDDLVDLAGRKARVLERQLARLDGALDELLDQRLELGAGELDREVLGAGGVGGDERQVDLGLHRARELDLGLLGAFLEALQRERVLAQVDALLLLELVGEVVDDALVEVLAAEEGIAIGRAHLEHAVADLEDRDVEGAAAEVVDRDRAAALLLEPVGERGGGRLVDDAHHLEPGDLAGVLGRLALGVVEVGGNRDHRLGDGLAEIAFGGFLHLLQDEGADLAGAVALAPRLDPGVAVVGLDDLVRDQTLVLFHHRVAVVAADEALDRGQRVLGVGHRLALGGLANEPLLIFGERHHRRRGARALGVLDHPGVAALHDRDTAVRGAEIDADNLAHPVPSRCGGLGRPRPAPPLSPYGSARLREVLTDGGWTRVI